MGTAHWSDFPKNVDTGFFFLFPFFWLCPIELPTSEKHIRFLQGRKRPFNITKHFYWNVCSFFVCTFYTGHWTRISRKKIKSPKIVTLLTEKRASKFCICFFFFFSHQNILFFFFFLQKRMIKEGWEHFQQECERAPSLPGTYCNIAPFFPPFYSIIQLHFFFFLESGTSLYFQ